MALEILLQVFGVHQMSLRRINDMLIATLFVILIGLTQSLIKDHRDLIFFSG
jgi:hypothetical protein